MAREHWKIEDLPWKELRPDLVDADLLKVIKAAALVEYNSGEYADYLCRVFHDDPEFQQDARNWSVEERQHGLSLGKWAEAVDPDWDLEEAMAKFREGFTPEHFNNEEANQASIRGSRTGEMVARCMVETGTSSYYSAIGDSTDEPVLKQICRNIAGDEFRHYKLFYDTLHRYLENDNLSRFQRLRIALGRIAETEDDELAYAFYAANANDNEGYDRKTYSRAYSQRAYGFYQPRHLDRAVSMIFKACGYKPNTLGYKMATRLAWAKLNAGARKRRKMAA